MAFRYSVEVRNAGLDARIAAIGPSPLLKIFADDQAIDGEPKALLVSLQLPRTWMGKAEDGAASNVGEWRGLAEADGKAKSFRIYDAKGKTCHIEGAIPADLKLDNANLAVDQGVTIVGFTIRSGNG